MDILRTPDERFNDLPDFPYEPHYIEIEGMRVHYVDEGKGEIILCLHGEPSWSFLYRKMIPPLSVKNGLVAAAAFALHRFRQVRQVPGHERLLLPDAQGHAESLHREPGPGWDHTGRT